MKGPHRITPLDISICHLHEKQEHCHVLILTDTKVSRLTQKFKMWKKKLHPSKRMSWKCGWLCGTIQDDAKEENECRKVCYDYMDLNASLWDLHESSNGYFNYSLLSSMLLICPQHLEIKWHLTNKCSALHKTNCVPHWNVRRDSGGEILVRKLLYLLGTVFFLVSNILLLPLVCTFALPCWTMKWPAQLPSTNGKILALHRYHQQFCRQNPPIWNCSKSAIFIKVNFTTLSWNPIICLTNVGLWDVCYALRKKNEIRNILFKK